MNIGLEKAKKIMISTTQKGIRTAVHPISRRYRVYHLDLHTSILAGKWNVDWILAGTKSLAQNAGDLCSPTELSPKFIPVSPNNKFLQIFILMISTTMLGFQKILRVIGTQSSLGRTMNPWNLINEKENFDLR